MSVRQGKETASCDEAREALLGQEPGQALLVEVSEHLEGCADCRRLAEELALLDDDLKAAAPELPESFAASLEARLAEVDAIATDEEQSKPQQPRRFWGRGGRRGWAVAVAAAASVLLAISAAWFLSSSSSDAPTLRYHRLRLSLVTPSAGDARLALTLPAGVRPLKSAGLVLDGDTLRFAAPLRAGHNELDLPLTSQGKGGRVQLQVTYGGRSFRSTLDLDHAPERHAKRDAASQVILALRLDGLRQGGTL